MINCPVKNPLHIFFKKLKHETEYKIAMGDQNNILDSPTMLATRGKRVFLGACCGFCGQQKESENKKHFSLC